VEIEKEKQMTHLFSRRSKTVLLVLISLFVSSACLTLTPGSPKATPTSPAGATTPLTGLPALPKAAVPVEGDLTFGPGSFNLTELGVGLADLSGYKATLTLSFAGSQDGKNQQWSKTYVMLTTKEPAARQLTIEKSGDNSDTDPVFMAETGGAAYTRRGTNACTATVIDSGNSLANGWEPAGFLAGVTGAQSAGSQTVNGVTADHYTFDERALGQVGIAKSTGEMWVASKGGYLVKYVLTTKGDANYFGAGIAGTLTWDYELTDANQPAGIQLPKDCPAGMVSAPQLPDATNVRNVPGLLTYDTSSSLADAVAFYQKQIPGLGWTPLGDPAINDTTALLDFTQADQTLTVTITAGDSGTKVHILLGSSQGAVPAH
jgi:hypothetical protein